MNSKGPKPGAFLPKPNHTLISMMGVDGLADAEIWPLGDIVGEGRARAAIARADVPNNAIRECGLSIESDPTPHPRHVNVAGWPIAKDEQKSIALDLCAKSALQRRPS